MERLSITIDEFDVNNLVFDEPIKATTLKNTWRIPIKYKQTVKERKIINGECVFEDRNVYYCPCLLTPELLSYGIQENRDINDKNNLNKPVESYSLPLILSSESMVKKLDEILEKCKSHLLLSTTKRTMSKGDDQLDVLTNMMQIYHRKRDNGVVVQGVPPTLYPKLFTEFQKVRDPTCNPKITTAIFGLHDRSRALMDPAIITRSATNNIKPKLVCSILLKDIFIGSAKPSIQLKVAEIGVVDIGNVTKRQLIPIYDSAPVESVFSSSTTFNNNENDDDDYNNDNVDNMRESFPQENVVVKVHRRIPPPQ